MTWQFHPKPQSKPVSVESVCPEETWKKYVNFRNAGGGLLNSYSTSKDPLPTIMKGGVQYYTSGKKHVFVPLSVLLKCSSFPDTFRFFGNEKEIIARIGNGVPPELMKEIAKNIRNAPFMEEVKKPTVISTFAGCGGSSLGYKLAGFKELLAVEWDKNAVDTFRLNFPEVPVYHGDITKLSGDECLKLAGIKKGELDVFDGSPPCQGFSTAGKRSFDDPRNSLFKEFARLLKELQPKVFVMENVTGMIKGVMKQAFLIIIKTLRECGYQVKGQVMNAMYYNVPQSRQRVILIGVRNDLGISASHPRPETNALSVKEAWKDLPKQTTPELSPFLRKVVPLMKQGQCADDISGKGGFQTVRILLNKPCPTITKLVAGVGFGALIHPTENRVLSIDEMKLATSFPLCFKFTGEYKEQKARIGNCVPPQPYESRCRAH